MKWKPKENDKCWIIATKQKDDGSYNLVFQCELWEGTLINIAKNYFGLYFRTRREAEQVVRKIKKLLKGEKG